MKVLRNHHIQMSSLAQNAVPEIELLPRRVSTCRLPLNLREDDLKLFRAELEIALPPARLLELHNVSISSDGFLYQGTQILPQSFAFPFLQDDWKKRSLVKFFALNYLSRKRRPFEEDALFVTDDWSTGYFHWLSDVLPKLSLISDRLNDLVLLLPHQLEGLEFVGSSLKTFNVKKIMFLAEQETLVCRKLFVPTSVAPSGRYDQAVIRNVRDRMVAHYAGSSTPKDLVYLSRSKAAKRRIGNEDEVIAVLTDYAFRVIHGEDCSFEQQVQIAAAARCFISNHGAGLTNIMFMSPGTHVLELRHRADETNNCYFTLASSSGLNYFYQTCAPAAGPDEDPHTADIIVDVATLRHNIERMLSLDAH